MILPHVIFLICSRPVHMDAVNTTAYTTVYTAFSTARSGPFHRSVAVPRSVYYAPATYISPAASNNTCLRLLPAPDLPYPARSVLTAPPPHCLLRVL